MASDSKGKIPSKSLIIIVLFLIQTLSPILTPDIPLSNSLKQIDSALSPPYVDQNTTLYGHDFAGNQISIDGLIDANIRHESALDMWNSHIIVNASNQTPSTPDIVFTGYQQIEMCWSTLEGQVRTLGRNISGGEKLMHVDDVTPYQSIEQVVDCAIAVKDNGRKTLLYADGNDIKAAQIALKSSLYSAGDTWHTRTILENVNATHFELAVMPSNLEWGVYRDDQGRLHRLSYSGTFWETQLLDSGPVGVDLELDINEYGEINLLYSKSNDAILMNINGSNTTQSIIKSDLNLHSQLGMSFDGNELMQVSTSSFDGNNSTISLQRSLANNKNQIGSVPISSINSQWENSSSGDIYFADFNFDGYSDLVTSQPKVNTWTSSDQSNMGISNGEVNIFYGSLSGLSSIANLTYYGEQDNQELGQGVTVGDFNGDGFDDLVIGSPGYNLNSGKLDIYFGSGNGLITSPVLIQDVSTPSLPGDFYGFDLVTISDLDGDGIDELLVFSPLYEDGSNKGRIQLYHGASQINDWGPLTAPSQNNQGSLFGRSISASGDLNGDGLPDLVVGNTGDFESPTGYSSVEVFYGSSNGYQSQSDISFQSNLQGTLFGYEVEIISDVNNDGFDEVFISEPNNGSNAFNSGMVWVFYGNQSGISSQPNLILTGQANDLIGLNLISAGDTNSDGFNDVLITASGSTTSGTVELYLGSSLGLGTQHYTVSGGGGGIGIYSDCSGDVNGDGIEDYVFSQETTNLSNSKILQYRIHSRELWESKDFIVLGELDILDLDISDNGKTNILTSSTYQGSTITRLLENAYDSTSSGQWLDHILTDFNFNNTTSALAVSSSGLPYVVMADGINGVVLRTPTSMTALESEVQSLGGSAQYIGQALDNYGNQHIAYSTLGNTQVSLNIQTETGWNFQTIRNSVSIEHPISVLSGTNNSSHLIYRDSTDNHLEYALFSNGLNIQNLGSIGQAVSISHSAIWLPNGDLAIALIENDGISNNLSLWTWNGSILNSSIIRAENDLLTDINLEITDDGIIILSAITSSGSLSLYERMWNESSWNGVLLDQPSGINGEYSLDLLGGDSPAMLVRSNSNSLYTREANQSWISVANQPESMVSGTWSLSQTDSHYISFTTNPDTGDLQWNSIEKNGIDNDSATWFSQSFKGIETTSNVAPISDQNGTINLALIEEVDNKVLSLNLYLDSDRDLIFDKIDDLPFLSGQWLDSDGDGFGENINAPQFDSCPQDNRTSSLLIYGCDDYDDDGYADIIDTCINIRGYSWLGRTGCGDFDQDGWSDNKISYQNGDIFTDNWKQVFDSDGDGYGDNHGPDCCTTWYDTTAQAGDSFPNNPKQFLDWDGDGYGDNTSDLLGGDRCRFDFGTSYRDRLGCLDSDFDGASDPVSGWGVEDGADMWPFDSTQWADSDGDGFGDNSSRNATNPDAFPNIIAAVNDTDGDGYPDNFTSFYNGTNGEGLYLDSCTLVAGNSSYPLFGCLDSDGDNYMDLYSYDINIDTGLRENQSGDAFPFVETQWRDTDGDGFGDLQTGYQADQCPSQPGVFNGTLGVGCRLIDNNDDDGDFVINDEDSCPNTLTGLMVNLDGCAQNQLDNDGDGVWNSDDICDFTASGVTADLMGCSQLQREVDADGDGVYDFEDSCAGTLQGDEVNNIGCSQSQSDTDGDGIFDSLDDCPDTPPSYPVNQTGCTDNAALEFDWDGDGYQGIYQYEFDEQANIRINQKGDYYPFEASQWWDADGDGYGDNATGIRADDCPIENGTSSQDRTGCLDSDGDGWSNPNLVDWFASPNGIADAFIEDSTQWKDLDGDGYGDNGIGINPDLCINTKSAYRESVDLNGCADNEKDSDGDGIFDSLDNCPNDAKGSNGYTDGCPLERSDSSKSTTKIFGVSILVFIMICVSGVVLLFFIVSFVRNRDGDDDDDDDEDDDDDDDEGEYYEDEPLSFLSKPKPPKQPQVSRSPGPSSGPPSFVQTNQPPRVPTPIQESSNSRSELSLPGIKSNKSTKKAKKVKASEVNDKKVRKAKLEVEEDLFTDLEIGHRDSSIDWVVISLSEEASERAILMQLQESGWNARQSRAIINLSKNR